MQKKRGDSHVLDWKNYVKYNTADKTTTCADKVSFIQTVLKQKKFMQQVGPGSYNLSESVQIVGKSPSKNRRRSLDESNLKMQELAAFKKQLLKGS